MSCDWNHDITPVEPADWAIPLTWTEIARSLGFDPIGHVVWSYKDASVFGRPTALCEYGRKIIAAVEEHERRAVGSYERR